MDPRVKGVMGDNPLFEYPTSNNRARRIFYTDFLWARSPIAADMIGKRLNISQYTCFVVCVVAVQFVRRLHYGLEISKLVFVVVVGKRFDYGLL
jgi:hypothetical protein